MFGRRRMSSHRHTRYTGKRQYVNSVVIFYSASVDQCNISDVPWRLKNMYETTPGQVKVKMFF